MSVRLVCSLFAIALGLAGQPSHAEIYKWKDAEGHTVFSEKQPPGTESTIVKPQTGAPSATTIEKLKASTAPPVEKAQDAAPEVAKAPVPTPEEKTANCVKSKEILTQLQNSNRLRYKQDNGELAYLTEDQRQQRIKDSQASVASWCKK